MAKGDVKVDNPVSLCGEDQSVVLNKGDILELKYFKLSDITSSKKGNKLHITRILEPDIPKIYKIIKESGLYNDYLNDNGSDVKFIKKFLEEIIDVIIEATKEIVAKDFEQIERTFDKVNGLIIAGPQYIKRENWKILIESGKTGQQGRGVAIVVQLPEDVKAQEGGENQFDSTGYEKEHVNLIMRDILQPSSTKWSDISGLRYAKALLEEAIVLPLWMPDYFQGILILY